uniref:Glyco_18 domain-containing protein n=1 Tax=Gongylonema pulchrum TaxID=637853 RepID=A0A183EFW3_9BILA
LILNYSIYRFRPFSPGDYDLYKRVVALKSSDSDLKVLISYGGYNFGSWTFTEIRETFDKSKPGLLLTAAVAAGEDTVLNAYDIKSMANSYDYIFLMSYDLHGSWESTTDMHAKLREKSGGGIYNTEYSAKVWVNGGMPKSKVVIGIPTYSKGYRLTSSANGLGASANGPAAPTAVYTDGAGAAYWEICDMIKSGGKETTETTAVGAYMSQGTNWHGYDNPASIKIKMEWILKEGYAGAFIWALDTDDFNGKHCGKGTYPLMNAINEGLGGAVLPETTTKTPGQVRKRFKLFERY